MSLQAWQANGWLRAHTASRDELTKLYRVIERDLKAAGNRRMDDDWRFVAAYNAALQCAAAAMKASGYEATKGGGAHHHTIESLRLTIGDDGTLVVPLQAFRAKRGGGIYEETDIASEQEIIELRQLAGDLFHRVRAYVQQQYPHLTPEQD